MYYPDSVRHSKPQVAIRTPLALPSGEVEGLLMHRNKTNDVEVRALFERKGLWRRA